MQWRNARQSGNVEDQRGGGGGMGAALPVGGGIGTLVIGLVIYLMGGNPSQVLNQGQQPAAPNAQAGRANPVARDETTQFVSSVLGDTEDVWRQLFQQSGRRYREPKLVLFSGQVGSACGVAGASTGPFYCPADEKLYLDTSFFQEMKSQLGAPGDFAQAYVIAHEVGHHVQNQLGTMDKVQAAQNQVDKKTSNQLSVRLELQADYYAGVWAHYAQKRGLLDPGDIEEGLNAASAVGDDTLQQKNRGYVVPDSFTHGSSQQRIAWFKRGFESGDFKQGNTFKGD